MILVNFVGLELTAKSVTIADESNVFEATNVKDALLENKTIGDIVNKQVNLSNNNVVDLNISIHFNSGANDKKGNGNTTGVEVLVYKTGWIAETTSKRICERISKLGYKNRGVKVRTDLGYLKNTKVPSLLVECCFVDDLDDINKYNYKLMAKSIVEGILNKTLSVETLKPQPVTNVFYRAISGSFNNKDNATSRKTQLESKWFTGVFLDAFVKDETTWYRVIAGLFKDKKLADQRINDLSKKGYDGGFVAAFRK